MRSPLPAVAVDAQRFVAPRCSPARWTREAVIRVADRLPLLKSAITQKLTRRSAFTWPALPTLPTLSLRAPPGRAPTPTSSPSSR